MRPWVVTRKALGLITGGWAVIDPPIGLQHTTLALTWSDRRSDWLVMSSPSTYIFYPDRTFCCFFYSKTVPAASSQPLSVSCLKAVAEGQLCWEWEFDQCRKLEIGNGSEAYPQLEYTSRISPSQLRGMGYLLGSFPTQYGLCSGWWSAGLVKDIQRLQAKNLHETSQNHTQRMRQQTSPDSLLLTSLEEVCLAKFSTFLLEKVISTRASLKTVKKTRNGNLLVEIDNRTGRKHIKK